MIVGQAYTYRWIHFTSKNASLCLHLSHTSRTFVHKILLDSGRKFIFGGKVTPMLVNGEVHNNSKIKRSYTYIIRLDCYLFHAVTRFEIMKEKMQQKLTSGIMKFLTL